jgi:recombination protein RecT
MANQNENQVVEQNKTVATQSERFLANVQKQFAAEAGAPVAFTDYEKSLAQHLFLKVDNVLKDFEEKRQKDGKNNITPYTWQNINMRKLALDAVHRVKLGLDALIPNHIHPVPYFNRREGKYDLDLRVGYVGKAYYRIQSAVETPVDVVFELVYSTDTFKPIKKSFNNPVESYEFEINNPFDRGNVIGGFGYIVYEDERKNTLVMVSEADFEKSRKAAQSDAFWSKYPIEMRYKTLVHRVTDRLTIDPKKINAASYAYVENQESETEARREINENANREVIDIVPDNSLNEPEFEPEPAVNKQNKAPEEQQQTQPQVQQLTGTDGPGW